MFDQVFNSVTLVLSVHGGIAIYSLLLTDADARAYQARRERESFRFRKISPFSTPPSSPLFSPSFPLSLAHIPFLFHVLSTLQDILTVDQDIFDQ